MVKNLPAVQEPQVCSLGWKDPLEEEVTTHSSIPGSLSARDLCFLLGASRDIFPSKLSQEHVSIFRKETN